MTQASAENTKYPSTSLSLSSSVSAHRHCSSSANVRSRNVFLLLSQREISPRARYHAKKCWSKSLKSEASNSKQRYGAGDARLDLFSWVESQSLHHWSAKYCPLLPPPRSTIAAAFSSDGKTIASTHGDHTVKIIDCQTGNCLKVLSGHRRTPWVVRFHPLCSDILASGSLDHEVRLWDAKTSNCIGSRDFSRPIASLAFDAKGELLAVASGHKLFIWNYNKRGEASSPVIVLKTRRSLRAVHFHPYGAPYLLTAEVTNLDSSDSSLTLATSSGYSHYPPAILFSNTHLDFCSRLPHLEAKFCSPCFWMPAILKDDGRILLLPSDWSNHAVCGQQRIGPEEGRQDHTVVPMDLCPAEPSTPEIAEQAVHSSLSENVETIRQQHTVDPLCCMPVDNAERLGSIEGISAPCVHCNRQPSSSADGQPSICDQGAASFSSLVASGFDIPMLLRNADAGRHQFNPFGDLPGSELHLSHGWLTAQGNPGHVVHAEASAGAVGIGQEFASSLFSAGAAELPCTVKLRIWKHNADDPCAALDTEACRLTISHAVLCSEMGAHFSPCGRFLVACVACLLPPSEGDHGSQVTVQYDPSGPSTSPTRHPLPSNRVIYELRIYSMEEATFGEVLASRAIRAAHCLTSIQFSPTSEHILLAYGRRHNSLLRSIIMDGDSAISMYTIMEVYRVSDMELVRVLPSAEDEVNVACFHPSPGCGLVYGTKEGKLRTLHYNGSRSTYCTCVSCFIEENVLETL